MSKVQSVGYSYNQTALKSSRGLAYQNYKKQDQDSVEFRTQKQVSFGGILTSFGKYISGCKERNNLMNNAIDRISGINSWMKGIIAGQTSKVEINGAEMSFKIDPSQKKYLDRAVDYCTDTFKEVYVRPLGIKPLIKIAEKQPELSPLFKEFFTRLKNSGCEHTCDGFILKDHYEFGEKLFSRKSRPRKEVS